MCICMYVYGSSGDIVVVTSSASRAALSPSLCVSQHFQNTRHKSKQQRRDYKKPLVAKCSRVELGLVGKIHMPQGRETRHRLGPSRPSGCYPEGLETGRFVRPEGRFFFFFFWLLVVVECVCADRFLMTAPHLAEKKPWQPNYSQPASSAYFFFDNTFSPSKFSDNPSRGFWIVCSAGPRPDDFLAQ
ncbi:hypothetical protein IWX47DRAFT_293672 [Phyllosticta citricarpa]